MHRLGGTIGVGLFMGRQYPEMGGTFGFLLAYIVAWAVRIFHYAFYGQMLFLELVAGSFAVSRSPAGTSPFFGHPTALLYLVYVDGGGDLTRLPPSGCTSSSGSRKWRNGYPQSSRSGLGRIWRTSPQFACMVKSSLGLPIIKRPPSL
ncbi:hypothetical protein ACNKHK_24715 [Shigella flexneri]